MYKHIFFDLDHTLLDFAAGEHIAITQVFESEGLVMTTELFEQYQSINKNLWQALERGEIKKDEVLTKRFSDFFQLQAITVDGSLKEQIFRTAINDSHHLLPGAIDILDYLKNKPVTLSSATNGVYTTQMKRMKDAGIYPYFSHHFISEEIGYSKPQPEFFAYALKNANAKPEEVLMVGDSITSDIAGAKAAGIDTCYIGSEKVDATYSISHLMELTDIIK
ncbi:noncanonical pyrimidine nucleotidase, YjjG family [Macrococcus brunensis]|uniref:Noncanonical pyrimidine nucleotidase, YjjG family n=1 Tax=Macrococcus brunensis TaxID=198483 RepID=A0A4R6BE75_9STAP|nr:YjjG family noncanonical pyrimidine nucleotidase [Macrococcus brunensis]TDL98111.1 noncanonical pyrimidine nucleotidase, YjjG family [Macrococcus brunensis]ULG74510.1 YjjG family noncanonical pyrimidine nucleotidase [Macrococcus brunensis]